MSQRLSSWKRSDGRYYEIWQGVDLLGDVIVTCAWGRVDSKRGRYQHIVCASDDRADQTVKRLVRRRQNHGYTRVA